MTKRSIDKYEAGIIKEPAIPINKKTPWWHPKRIRFESNYVYLRGRVAAEPESKRTPRGNLEVTFFINVQTFIQNQTRSRKDFFCIRIAGAAAHACKKEIEVGGLVHVWGSLISRTVQVGKKKVVRVEVRAYDVERVTEQDGEIYWSEWQGNSSATERNGS